MDTANGYMKQIISQLVDFHHIAVWYIISLPLQLIKPTLVKEGSWIVSEPQCPGEVNLFFSMKSWPISIFCSLVCWQLVPFDSYYSREGFEKRQWETWTQISNFSNSSPIRLYFFHRYFQFTGEWNTVKVIL